MMSARADVLCVRSLTPFLRLVCRCIILSARLWYAYQFASGLYLLSTLFNMHSKTADEFLFQRFWCGIIRSISFFVVLTSLDVFALSVERSIETTREWEAPPDPAHVFTTSLAFLALTQSAEQLLGIVWGSLGAPSKFN
jgi:hypothetical protein